MARRNQRKGDHLFCDELTGFTTYASRIRTGYYGERAVKPLKRNYQEIASPLNDPLPVQLSSGSNYETYNICNLEMAPLYVGTTTIRTNTMAAALQVPGIGFNPGIGEMEIGCTFRVA